MGFTSFLSALFGNKSKRDLSKLMPIVEQIKAVEPSLLGISNDELRQKITEARTRIQESVADQRGRIAKLKEEIETLEYDKREPLWTEIDKLEKTRMDVRNFSHTEDNYMPWAYLLLALVVVEILARYTVLRNIP